MIGFVVEDNAHEKTVLELREKMGFNTSRKFIRVMKGNRWKKALRNAQDMLSRECPKVIVLKAMDENRPSDLEKRFQEMQFPPQTSVSLLRNCENAQAKIILTR